MRNLKVLLLCVCIYSCSFTRGQDISYFDHPIYYGFDEENLTTSVAAELGSSTMKIRTSNFISNENSVNIDGVIFDFLSKDKLQGVEIFVGKEQGENIKAIEKIGITNQRGEFKIKIPIGFKGYLVFWKTSFLAMVFEIT